VPYAIVQHSGVTTGHAEFEQAVEHVQVTARAAQKVRKVGGLVVEDWIDGELLAEQINYPQDYMGLTPAARGTFSDVTVCGLRVYLPVRQVVG
jgi:hypothetical protein